MSTRGSVAWKDGKKWVGVYNHSDSYPTWLGQQVFEACQKLGAEKVIGRLKGLGDWREFESGGVCGYCGKVAGQPHSISGVMGGFGDMGRENFIKMRKEQSAGRPDLWKDYESEIAALDEVEKDKKRTGFPDPEAKHHQHGKSEAEQFDPRKDPLFIEWIYLILPQKNAIEVYAHAMVPKTHKGKVRLDPKCHGKGKYYGHFLVGQLSLDKTMTDKDFKALEDRGHHMGEKLYEAAHIEQNAAKGPRVLVTVEFCGPEAQKEAENLADYARHSDAAYKAKVVGLHPDDSEDKSWTGWERPSGTRKKSGRGPL